MTIVVRALSMAAIGGTIGAWIPAIASGQTESEGPQEVTYEIFAVDSDGDGTIDFSETITTVYDENGNVVTTTTQGCNSGVGNGADCRPGMARWNNDDLEGQGPGSPGARLHDETVEY